MSSTRVDGSNSNKHPLDIAKRKFENYVKYRDYFAIRHSSNIVGIIIFGYLMCCASYLSLGFCLLMISITQANNATNTLEVCLECLPPATISFITAVITQKTFYNSKKNEVNSNSVVIIATLTWLLYLCNAMIREYSAVSTYWYAGHWSVGYSNSHSNHHRIIYYVSVIYSSFTFWLTIVWLYFICFPIPNFVSNASQTPVEVAPKLSKGNYETGQNLLDIESQIENCWNLSSILIF